MTFSHDEPVFQISVVARMVGLHQQTIRSYERIGLLQPARSQGNTRLFSREDVERLQQVVRLVNDLGVNLAGVEVILQMRRQIEEMQRELAQMRAEADHQGRTGDRGIGDSGRVAVPNAVLDLRAALVRLHEDAIRSYWTKAPSLDLHLHSRDAFGALARHDLRLAEATYGLIESGQFDVAAYLFRALFDCHSLLLGCAVSEDVGRKLMVEQMEKVAVEARKVGVAYFRERGEPEFAALLDGRHMTDYHTVNDMAHLNIGHLDRAVAAAGSGAAEFWASALTLHRRALMWIGMFGLVDEGWNADFADVSSRLATFANGVKAGKQS